MIPKFRAYLKGTGVIDVLEIDFRFKTIEFYIYVDGAPHAKTEYIENVELLQYTGLKDKNDTEIFEGDILKYWGECRPVVSHEASFGWIEGGYYIPFPMMCISEIGNTEVVGNVYENKEELL